MNRKEEAWCAKVNAALGRLTRLQAKAVKVKIGHTYYRCYLQVGATVKEHRIRNYAEYIARELRLPSLPIVHTDYSEGAIILDIPNEERETVRLSTCLKSKEFKNSLASQVGLPYVVGVDNGGEVICGDLTEAPHMLIAGQSGSGKSVALRCVLNSIIAAWSDYPDWCQYILIDPKGVELIHYRDIPQLVPGGYTSDPRVTEMILERLVEEMEERYERFVKLASYTKEDIYSIKAFNRYYFQEVNQPCHAMPYITVFIDELADVLLNNPDCQKTILRLVQKARAAGIHIVMATQRPSNEVISGPIRANIPTKICCKVSRPIDGRVVFGDSDHGAHRLLGEGDMLYIDEKYSEPIRLQGAYTDADFLRSYRHFLKNGRVEVIPLNIHEMKTGIHDEKPIPPFEVSSYTKRQIVNG